MPQKRKRQDESNAAPPAKKQKMTLFPIQAFSDVLISNVALFLHGTDLLRIAATCSAWRRSITAPENDEHLWKQVVKLALGFVPASKTTWLNCYKELYANSFVVILVVPNVL